MARSRFISMISRSRPTKLVLGAGRLCLLASGASTREEPACWRGLWGICQPLCPHAGCGFWCQVPYRDAPRELPAAFRIGGEPRLSTRECIQAHQAKMGLLASRLLCHGHPQGLHSLPEVTSFLVGFGKFDEQVQIQPPKRTSSLLRPPLVAVFWQQLPGIQVERRSVGCGSRPRRAVAPASSKASRSTHNELSGAQKERVVLGNQVARACDRI